MRRPNLLNSNHSDPSAPTPKRKHYFGWIKYIVFAVIIRNIFRFLPLIALYFIFSNTGIMKTILGNGVIGGVGSPIINDISTESPSVSIISVDSTPLIRASIAGDIKTVEKLLAKDIPVNGRDNEQRTALIGAAYHEQNAICKRLISAGANPYMQDSNGFNALDFAAARGLVDTVKLLLKESKNPDSKRHIEYAMLMQAAFSGNTVLMPPKEIPILHSINRLSPEDKTPLHIAASSGSVEMVSELIKRGAKTGVANLSGQTPLHWAAWSNKPEIISLLLKNSAKIDVADGDGMTPLMLAAQKGGRESVMLLLEKGADKKIFNKNGDDAFAIATTNGFLEIADILQEP